MGVELLALVSLDEAVCEAAENAKVIDVRFVACENLQRHTPHESLLRSPVADVYGSTNGLFPESGGHASSLKHGVRSFD